MDSAERRARAAQELSLREDRQDTNSIVNSLCYGLDTLRNLLFTRVHQDVQKYVGRDSMMVPVSLLESEETTKQEIEIFQLAISTEDAREHGYVSDSSWYAQWLTTLRLDDCGPDSPATKRLQQYVSLPAPERRAKFLRVLERTFPQATRSPLVLYRLFPLAVQIVTAQAFGDSASAIQLRKQQSTWLPSISDCQECRGRLLENGEQCASCCNPLWKYEWLTAAD
jgi:hypothetical protein